MLTPEKTSHCFYSRYVHAWLYDNIENVLKKYQNRILRELRQVGLSRDWLRDKVVFDMGTGLQSIVFARLGARHVFHLDVDDQQSARLIDYCRTRKLTNISSESGDCLEDLGSLRNFDLAFLCGILNHLTRPSRLFQHLLDRATPGSRIFVRCYHAGTWSRWLVAFLRQISQDLNPEIVNSAFLDRHPHHPDRQFLSDMMDDLFTPVWQCFTPGQFRSDASLMGLEFFCPDEKASTDQDPFGMRDENFRFLVTVTPQSHFPKKPQIFQMDGNVFVPHPDGDRTGANSFQTLWRNFRQSLARQDPYIRANRLVTLYMLSRSRQHVDDYRCMPLKPQQSLPGHLGATRMKMLTGILKLWLKCGDLSSNSPRQYIP